MMLQRHARLLIAVPAAVIAATTACTSGTTGEPTPSSASVSAQASPAFPSESVPPGVEKDSVLDLNSTKDMTGVVTTVPFGDSPYAAHLPDVCSLIPDSALNKLGVTTKKRGFRGTQLVSQACVMRAMNDQGQILYTVTIGIYTNNIEELASPKQAVTIKKGIALSPTITGRTTKLIPSTPDDETYRTTCGTAWGTFFGSAIVNFRSVSNEDSDPCSRSIDSARISVGFMPVRPSQMRAAP